MDDQSVSLGEVARRLDDVLHQYEQLANDLPRNFVSRDLFDSRRETVDAERAGVKQILDAQDKRIDQLEQDKTWLYRLVISAVILAIMGVVISTTILSQHGVVK